MARTRSKRGVGSAKRRNSTAFKKIRKVVAAAAARATAATEAALAASRPTPFTLEGFAIIPHEIKTHILKLACSALPSSSSTATVSPLASRLDIKTTLSFTLAFHSLYALVARLLYKQVWISRPSGLASFYFALSNRPYLGALVKSLHVGPDSELRDWDPVSKYTRCSCPECLQQQRYRPSGTYIRTSLKAPQDVELLPKWCSSMASFGADVTSSDERHAAVCKALSVAQRTIGVNLEVSSRDRRGESLPVVEHTMRVFEVQATLDLYLIAMRRWESEQDINDEQRGRSDRKVDDSGSDGVGRVTYPLLVLTGYSTLTSPAEASTNGQEPYVLSRSDLLHHLARPGSWTDRFDHPLLFARSGENIVEAQGYHDYGARQERENPAAGDWADLLTSHQRVSPDYGLTNTGTIGSLLALLRAVLSHTPYLENLSLTGFLERAVCGTRPSVALQRLRALSVGPPPSQWYAPLHFDNRLSSLEELRLCGIRLCEVEISAVLTKLPTLRRLQWTMMHKFALEHVPRWVEVGLRSMLDKAPKTDRRQDDFFPSVSHSLQDSIDRLAGRDPTLPSEAAEEATSDSEPRLLGQDLPTRSGQLPSTSKSLPLVEIRLYPTDLEMLLNNAPSPAIREAWETGSALPGQRRRLLLRESPSKGNGPWWPSRISTKDDLYEEGREWWQERSGALRGGRLA